jgi:ABC-type phosphate transport system substrate-binding protein
MAPLPNTPAAALKHHRVHGDLSVDLHAGGGASPGVAYNLGAQPLGTPGPYGTGQATPGPGSVLYAAEQNFSDSAIVYYCSASSSYGRAAFESNNGTATKACGPDNAAPTGLGGEEDPLDFAGTDVAMTSLECCASGTTYYTGRLTGSKTWGQPFEIPIWGGVIAFGYVENSFTGLKSPAPLQLSTWTYCAIANGTVGNWDDPAITADNNGKSVTDGLSEPINFYYRSDSAATSYNLQYKLANSTSGCNQSFGAPYNAPPYGSASRSAAWTYGYSNTWKGPTGAQSSGSTFTSEYGNAGIILAIQDDSTGFGFGYVEGAWAATTAGENPPVAQASVQNGFKTKGGKQVANFVSPTNSVAVADALAQISGSKSIQYGEGSDGNPLASTTPWCQLDIPSSEYVTPKTVHAYPIVEISYMLLYGKNNGVHLTDKTALVTYLTNETNLKSVLVPLEYSPLAQSFGTKIADALKGSKKQPSCLQ